MGKVDRFSRRPDWRKGTEKDNKNRTLVPNKAPEKPWMHIIADFITKLPLAQGYNTILVVCD